MEEDGNNYQRAGKKHLETPPFCDQSALFPVVLLASGALGGWVLPSPLLLAAEHHENLENKRENLLLAKIFFLVHKQLYCLCLWSLSLSHLIPLSLSSSRPFVLSLASSHCLFVSLSLCVFVYSGQASIRKFY